MIASSSHFGINEVTQREVGHGIMVLNPTSSLNARFPHHHFSLKTRPHIFVKLKCTFKTDRLLAVMLVNVLHNVTMHALLSYFHLICKLKKYTKIMVIRRKSRSNML